MPELATKTDETKIDESTKPVPGTGHLGQTFLVGENVYIRAIEPADAKYGQSWANTLLPRSTDRNEKWIKEEMPEQKRSAVYVILRKRDDVPVGSVRTWRYDPLTFLQCDVDPLLGEQGRRWKADALRMALPWLVDEQNRPVVALLVGADEAPAIDALDDIGAIQTARFREQVLTWGGRTDHLHYQFLNRKWVERLGNPADIVVPRSGTGEARPVPGPVTLDADPPANAVRVGERVYLRPLEKKDAPLIARWSRQETETFWDAGRFMYSAPGFEAWTTGDQKKNPPSHVRFAVCLRENDELIGSLGIAGIDYINGFAESESEINRPEYRGGGYGSEAKHLLFDYAFNTLNLHALHSTVIFPNTRSAAALRKQGYREAGRAYWAFSSFGKFENFVCFDLLADDWRKMPRTGGASAEGGGA
jgi:RimJ/RimL family protein N-acetyltransferase